MLYWLEENFERLGNSGEDDPRAALFRKHKPVKVASPREQLSSGQIQEMKRKSCDVIPVLAVPEKVERPKLRQPSSIFRPSDPLEKVRPGCNVYASLVSHIPTAST